MPGSITEEALANRSIWIMGEMYASFLSVLKSILPSFGALEKEKLEGCNLDVVKRDSPGDPTAKKWLRIKVYHMHDVREVLKDVSPGHPFSEIIVGYKSTRRDYRYNPIPYIDAETSYIYLPYEEFMTLVWPLWKD